MEHENREGVKSAFAAKKIPGDRSTLFPCDWCVFLTCEVMYPVTIDAVFVSGCS